MPRAQVVDIETGDVLEELGDFETAGAGRAACGDHAGGMLLIWRRNREGVWVTADDPVMYEVEPELSEA